MRCKKHKGLFMKVLLAAMILQVLIYTWVHLWLSARAGLEIAPTTSLGFYGFCGLEAGVCGMIKKWKRKA